MPSSGWGEPRGGQMMISDLNPHRAANTIGVLALSALALLSSQAANAQTCGLISSFMQPDEAPRKVLYDSRVVVFSEKFAVNTDGNIRSYSAKDPAGDLCGLP